MEYKILNPESVISRTSLTENQFKKYSKLLNNLLNIANVGDQAVFTKLSSTNCFEISSLVEKKYIEKIFQNCEFKIKISEKNFLIEKWKKAIKRINDLYNQTNMWPLFIGTYFLKGNPGDKTIYAPLILKEVDILIENNDVFLVSRNSLVAINEKLKFLLEEFTGINIPNIDDQLTKVSIDELGFELDAFLKNSIDFESFAISDEFESIKAQDIKNKKMARTDGMVLFFAQPLGGKLRSAIIDLINDNRIDNLINVNLDNLLASKEESIKKVVEKPQRIVRICPTDPSQEKAIIQALNDNVIIIGPPGTGKSQTIANILTNILAENKKALFISQKRVALEVVLERMKTLKYFTLQLVNSTAKATTSEKGVFYDYIANFIELTRSVNGIEHICAKTPLVSNDFLHYWNAKININLTNQDIEIFSQLRKNVPSFSWDAAQNLTILFNQFKNINKFDGIEKVFELNKLNKKEFAKLIAVEPKLNLLGIKIFDKNFNNFYLLNERLYSVAKENGLNKEQISLLKKCENLFVINDLFEAYKYHEDEMPRTNSFVSDEKLVRCVCVEKIKKIYEAIDKKTLRKMIGYVERAFAQPNKFISIFKKELKQLFNVYVSTPEALASFIDFKNDHFDYVIFDEASQIFLEKAIPFISVADKVIIAGDNQQMQPSNWFGHRSDVDDDEKMDENIDSLLTYAIEQGIRQEMLELNYRSAAASLTTFSSKEFYDSNLKTVDNNSSKIIKPIEIINVNGIWKNNQNEIEAAKAIEILKENYNKYKKIILLTLNKQQINLIESELVTKEPEIYNKIIDGDIILKNLENIQGDEADLVIVSIGYTKDTALHSSYVGRPGGRNALNVAITRAKEKMIVIKSINSSEIKTKTELNKDLTTFKNWIQFLELNEEDQKSYILLDDENSKSVESNFEYDVVNWLRTKRFVKPLKLTTQYPIGSYRIDIALLDPQSNRFILGIEVDGFLYHSTVKQRYNDLIRQNFIETKGYPLIRISELLWKTDKEKVYQMINDKLLTI